MFAVKSCIILVVFCFMTNISADDIGDVIERVPDIGKLESQLLKTNLKLPFFLL